VPSDAPVCGYIGPRPSVCRNGDGRPCERPERSIRDLAATVATTPVYKENGSNGPGLYAYGQVLPQWRDTIKALAPHIGVSIRAHGKSRTRWYDITS
jgi:hypothetical protein